MFESPGVHDKQIMEQLQNTRPRLRDINLVLPWSRSCDVNHEMKNGKRGKKYFEINKVDGVGVELLLPQSRTPVVEKKVNFRRA